MKAQMSVTLDSQLASLNMGLIEILRLLKKWLPYSQLKSLQELLIY